MCGWVLASPALLLLLFSSAPLARRVRLFISRAHYKNRLRCMARELQCVCGVSAAVCTLLLLLLLLLLLFP